MVSVSIADYDSDRPGVARVVHVAHQHPNYFEQLEYSLIWQCLHCTPAC